VRASRASRSFRLRKYRSCFVGSDAVSWMLRSGLAGSVYEAVELGNAMLRLGLLHHVKYEHPFENKHLFYR
jgi:potassium-dependent mechanosensitive channel